MAPELNPIMREMFADRGKTVKRCLIAHSAGILVNEYPAKYLTGAAKVLGLTRDEMLRAHLHNFLYELLELQGEDGYLGPWPKEYQFFEGVIPGLREVTWDAWGHYHFMLGLLA